MNDLRTTAQSRDERALGQRQWVTLTNEFGGGKSLASLQLIKHYEGLLVFGRS